MPIVNRATLQTGAHLALFRARIVFQGSQGLGLFTLYDVAADGQRFLLSVPPEDPSPPIMVVFNWPTALAR